MNEYGDSVGAHSLSIERLSDRGPPERMGKRPYATGNVDLMPTKRERTQPRVC